MWQGQLLETYAFMEAQRAVGFTGENPLNPTAPRLTRDAWWTIAVLNLLYVLSFADRQVIAMLVGPIKADLQLSDFKMSLLMGLSFALLYGIAGLPMGYLA